MAARNFFRPGYIPCTEGGPPFETPVIQNHFTEEEVDKALCAQIGGDEWFPEKGGSVQEAISVCNRCEIRERCLEIALDRDETIRGLGRSHLSATTQNPKREVVATENRNGS